MNTCINCGREKERLSYKYCSNKCQWQYQYKEYIQKWQMGVVTGNRGVRAKNISKHLRRFLIEKHGERCSLCRWSKKNPITKKVPLEINHIDGNADNNNENNLQLVCPNCHSLTSTFRNLNKGKGRLWRR